MLALLFLTLAYLGIRGERPARRQGELDEILLCRDQLQEALDAMRAASSGPTAKLPAATEPPWLRGVKEWSAKLGRRVREFESQHAPLSGSEARDLRLAAGILAIAERRFADGLSAIGAASEPAASDDARGRDRRTEILRASADAHYDSGDRSRALDLYGEILARQPEQLSVAERSAECLFSLQQVDRALTAYAELAQRLHNRGSRLATQLDHKGAVRDLNKAATIRRWLHEQGRHDVAADLARSFSLCARALVELQNFELARVYWSQAIDIGSQLLRRGNRDDLAADVAHDHAALAEVLLELGQADEASAQVGHAIDLQVRLVGQGHLELQGELATNLARRGLIREALGHREAAAQDFEQAAAAYATLGKLAEAVTWETKAVGLSSGDMAEQAQKRLEEYRPGAPGKR